MPRQIAALRGFLDAQDPPAAGRQAHTIRGAAATVEGNEMRAIAAEMEQSVTDDDLDGAAAHLASLDEAYQRLIGAMSAGSGVLGEDDGWSG
jgi:HPt (histidine-containing phosphotransfer) domain-containing protein